MNSRILFTIIISVIVSTLLTILLMQGSIFHPELDLIKKYALCFFIGWGIGNFVFCFFNFLKFLLFKD